MLRETSRKKRGKGIYKYISNDKRVISDDVVDSQRAALPFYSLGENEKLIGGFRVKEI